MKMKNFIPEPQRLHIKKKTKQTKKQKKQSLESLVWVFSPTELNDPNW